RHRGLERDLGGLAVADLAEEDDVRVLPEDRAERGREREARLLVHLDLVQARELVLDRVLDGDDVERLRRDVAERGEEGRALDAARRARDEDRALREGDGLADELEVLRAEAEDAEPGDRLLR